MTNIRGDEPRLVKSIKYRLPFHVGQLGRLYQYEPRPMQVAARPQLTLPPGTTWPSIAMVTPSYNQAQYLEQTIKSVLDQGYPALEYVVQDGASKDASPHIIERYKDKLTYSESAPDSGQTNAINKGFRHTRGEIMAWLNSDDMLLPGTLQLVGKFFAEHPEVDVVYGHRIIVDENSYEIGRWVLPQHGNRILSFADYIPQETLFWRRSVWDKAGGQVDEQFKFAMDWDLILRLRDVGARFVRLPYFMAAFRVHAAQKTSAQITDIGFQEMNKLRSRCQGGRRVGQTETYLNTRLFMYTHFVYATLYLMGILKYD
ncbi:MAG: glycosyltransferase family 2 protein [Anaerolineae bacterium]